MADLRPVNRFTARLTLLESRYIAALRAEADETRKILAAILTADGLNNYSLKVMFHREMESLRRSAREIAGEYSQPIEPISRELAQANFEQVRKLTGALPDIDQAAAAIEGQKAKALGKVSDSVASWLESLELHLNTEISRLQSAEETTEAAAQRLLAEKVADGRASVWRSGVNAVVVEAVRDVWGAAANLSGGFNKEGQRQTGQVWKKQVIAGIDERTTDCCLRVHGQIQNLDDEFILTGTPRFADKMKRPPFHAHCRTAETLWLAEFEEVGVTTAEMREAALAEREARKDGSRVEIHPAHATSRR
jgi:hypothetical protein